MKTLLLGGCNMEHKIELGMSFEFEMTVEHKDTAEYFGSGSVLVLATPVMIGLMEKASMKAVQSGLLDGFTTVGTKVDITHKGATPISMKVKFFAELIEIDRKRLVFQVKAMDEKEEVGSGIHERFIIETEKFVAKANLKLN